jgi:phosphoenolpyruvate synthase/pyruvate phosphate dikinase
MKIIDKNIADQTRGIYRKEGPNPSDGQAHNPKDGGPNEWRDIGPEKGSEQVLSDIEILELSKLVVKIEEHYGFPCDIEWAREARPNAEGGRGGKFYIVQSRPITTLSNANNAVSEVSPIKISSYFVFEELYNANPMVLHRFVDLGFIDDFFSKIGTTGRISKAVIRYRKERNTIYFLSDEFDEISRYVVDIFINDPKRANEINQSIIATAKDLINTNQAYATILDSSVLTQAELLALWKQMEDAYSQLFKYTWIHNSLDFKDNLFTTHIFNYLNDYILEKGLDINVNDAFIKLTTPENKYTHLVKLEEELFNLQREMVELGVLTFADISTNEKLDQKLNDVASRYCWLGFGFDGPPWDKQHFFDMLWQATVKSPRKVVEERSALLHDLSLDRDYENIFELARHVVEGTEFRKEAMFNYYYTLDKVFERLSIFLNIPKTQLRYVYPDEIGRLESVLTELPSRVELHIDYETPEGRTILLEDDAEEFFSKMPILSQEKFNGKSLNGQTSFPGKIKGVVKIVNEKADIVKVEKGDILVSIATNPELIFAIKMAAALVTDRGGITCHAAIISRELKKPCIIGTKIATQVLHDGDLVEVDADKGIVRIIKRAQEKI